MPDSEPAGYFPDRRSRESTLVRGEMQDSDPIAQTPRPGESWPDDLAEILYVDHYGNCVTGLRAVTMRPEQTLRAGGEPVKYARIFSDVPPGTVFWYENANGLVEIAVNRGSAAARLGLKPGDPIVFLEK